ncbi:hypothetical protein V1264_004274 [Littorina saxatilis]
MASDEETPAVVSDNESVTDQLEGSLIEGDIEDEAELMCQICEEKLKEPKLLSCLHAFCQDCLEKQVEEESAPVDGEPTKPLLCPACKQETVLPGGHVENLMTDYVAVDLLKPKSEKTLIMCTSCKANEEAIARCAKCPNFLCSHCTAAHKFMRCFEDHTVDMFEDILLAGGRIEFHQPILCPKHKEENLTSFCNYCQVAVCPKCIVSEHKPSEHRCSLLSDVEGMHVEELKALAKQGRNKLEKSQEDSQALESALSELQEQTDNAKGLITETFQSYKSILEKLKDDLLSELEDKHTKQELLLMDTYHVLGTNETRLDDACDFVDRLVKHDSPTYATMFKKMVQGQMLGLINSSPKTDISVNIEFKTDPESFKAAMKQSFGWFVKDQAKAPSELRLSSVHSSFENEAAFNQLTAAGILTPEELVARVTESEFLSARLPNMSVNPLSALNGNLENLTNLASVASSLAGATSIPPLDSSLSRASLSPAMSDSGISVDAASTNSNNSATMMNIAAMAKLTSAGLSGQAILGSSLNSVSAASPTNVSGGSALTSRTQTPLSHSMEGMRSILSVSPTHVQPGNLEQLASILQNHPPPPTLNSLPFNTLGVMDPVSSGTGGELGSSGLGSPTGSTFGSGGNLPYPPVRRPTKMSAMQIRCKFGQLGPGKGQFNSPHGFCLGLDQDIIVADTNNHRIQVFEKTGEFKTQFGIPGREEGQLWYPRKVAVMRTSGKFVVCDRGNERSRMQIFTRHGHFLKKIAIRYIDIVAGLAITANGNIVAVDSVSPTVFVISEAGELLKWFDCSDYMREPSDIAVSSKECFVCDFKGHCVVVFNEDGNFLRRIGCENITNYPNGIDISDAGDVLIGDSHGNRFHVAVFQRDGSLIGEFQCPYVKVSRCCGLKITSEGYIVTLAKNNHHVLVLNTLYIS